MKLQTRECVNIACWGDSVTEGSSASSPEKNFVGLLRAELTAAYPGANINVVNAGIGGTTTDSRRADFFDEVLAFKPDLIIGEFVNDFCMPPEKVASSWHEIISLAREQLPNLEFILITPHFMMREWMRDFALSAVAICEVADEAEVAVADTANVWLNLQGLGIPYETLLANCINHPNDLGHQFFATTLMALLNPVPDRN